MIETQTRRLIHVSTDGTARPYIMVPVDQFGFVRTLLDGHEIRYWVESDATSLSGRPEIAIINLVLAGDSSQVQQLLNNGVRTRFK